MVNLTINGQKIEVQEGTTLLEAAEKVGIKIPTLCSHKALLPYGACRLCLVEVGEGNRAKIHASCTHPAVEGLVVRTDTERVMKVRKVIAELLLARCPDVKSIRDIAEGLGVKETRFSKKNDDCVLCGLCVRMCRDRMGPDAISFVNRGVKRSVKTPYGVPSDACQACGACGVICPTGKIKISEYTAKEQRPIPYEHNEGLISRSAVYIPYPQAIPNKAVIDKRFCVHLLRGTCEVCKDICEAGAIDYEQKEKNISLNVGTVILSPGYELFDANLKKELGIDRYDNVVTGLEFERILSASGPYSGKILKPSDSLPPKKIAFVQCVGSRDTEHNYCSSVCCMYATKEAIIAKEHAPELDCSIFIIDIRAFGKGFEEYYERAKKLGIKYVRCRPSAIKENYKTKNLKIRYQAEDGKVETEEFDLVILSTGICPPEFAKEVKEKLGIGLNEHGFCDTPVFEPVSTNREGIFAAGPFVEPKDIPETVMQSSAAAAKALSLLCDKKNSLIIRKEFPREKDVSGEPPRVGVFVCHCGTNIAGVVNVPSCIEYARALPDVVYAENNLYTCSNDTQERIKKLINEQNLNRLVVASCSPRTHEPLFRNTCREAGLNPYLFEMANIRDQCSWAHMHEPEAATKKAKDLIRIAVAKARLLEPLKTKSVGIKKSALVLGGGVSGMNAALELAGQGFVVHLVEKEKELGGNLRKVHYLLNGDDPRGYLEALIDKVFKNEKIHVYTGSRVSSIDGFIGNFKTKVEGEDGTKEVEHGVIIVATGAEEYKTKEYLYGQNDRVVTQLELEEGIFKNRIDVPALKSVVMIQCVGSRCGSAAEGNRYCSRICCQEAIKNALKIKGLNPWTKVYVLYRDIRAYGFKESYYTKARERGVVFIRYSEDKKPEVKAVNGGEVTVTVHDEILQKEIVLPADLVALSVAMAASPENKDIAQKLKVPLTQDSFFLEAHMKLRPVDFATEGVFLCGLAHSPKLVDESIIQSLAAAARASTVLSKDFLEVEPTTSFVVDENCDGCAYCIDPCPYKALALVEYMRDGSIKKTVEVNETACKGCGTCMATCPKKGIYVKGFKLEQIAAQVEAALAG